MWFESDIVDHKFEWEMNSENEDELFVEDKLDKQAQRKYRINWTKLFNIGGGECFVGFIQLTYGISMAWSFVGEDERAKMSSSIFRKLSGEEGTREYLAICSNVRCR